MGSRERPKPKRRRKFLEKENVGQENAGKQYGFSIFDVFSKSKFSTLFFGASSEEDEAEFEDEGWASIVDSRFQ